MYKGKCRTFRCVKCHTSIWSLLENLAAGSVMCHFSDLSRMYCDRGARLNVPNPLPQRQMPMARARLVVK